MYKFIRIKDRPGEGYCNTGYFVPRLYQIVGLRIGLKIFGLRYIKYRLDGWTIWRVENEKDYNVAIKTLNELKKTRLFTYEVSD